jgi:hypothetical protein
MNDYKSYPTVCHRFLLAMRHLYCIECDCAEGNEILPLRLGKTMVSAGMLVVVVVVVVVNTPIIECMDVARGGGMQP